MLHDSDVFISKVQLIMESPTERNKYNHLPSIEEKLAFLRNHFIMNEMAVRLLERKYLLSRDSRNELMATIDDMIQRWNS